MRRVRLSRVASLTVVRARARAGAAAAARAPAPVARPAPPPVAAVAAAAPRRARRGSAHRVVTDAVAVPGGRLAHRQVRARPASPSPAPMACRGRRSSRRTTSKPPYTIEIGDKLLLPSTRARSRRRRRPSARGRSASTSTTLSPAPSRQAAGRRRCARPSARTAAAPSAAATRPRRRRRRRVAAPGRETRRAESRWRPQLAPLPALPTGTPPVFAWPVEGRILSGFGPKPGGRDNDGINLKAYPTLARRGRRGGRLPARGRGVRQSGPDQARRRLGLGLWPQRDAAGRARRRASQRATSSRGRGRPSRSTSRSSISNCAAGGPPTDPVKLLPTRSMTRRDDVARRSR